MANIKTLLRPYLLPLGGFSPSPPCWAVAVFPLGERVDRDGAFISQRGAGLRPPKGYDPSAHTACYGLQTGEGVR